jgi:ribosomal protein S18 acetylase RimI-like enzyme
MLLAKEFPRESAAKLVDRWEGGLDEEGFFEGCNVVQVMILKGETLIGFIKALVVPHEIFIDELLITKAARGRGLSAHLAAQLTAMFPKVRRVRLQVRSDNRTAIHVYTKWGMGRWNAPKSEASAWHGILPEDESFEFMGARRAAVHENVVRLSQEKPLAQNLTVLRRSAFPIPKD